MTESVSAVSGARGNTLGRINCKGIRGELSGVTKMFCYLCGSSYICQNANYPLYYGYNVFYANDTSIKCFLIVSNKVVFKEQTKTYNFLWGKRNNTIVFWPHTKSKIVVHFI